MNGEYPPTPTEAEKDYHNDELAAGRCRPTDPCRACRWAYTQTRFR